MAATAYAWYKYVDDTGKAWAKKAATYIGGQACVGATAMTQADLATVDIMPKNMRPRVAYVWNATEGTAHKVVCFTHDATLYCGAGVSVNLRSGAPSGAALTAFTSYGHEGEKVIYSIRDLPAGG